MSRQVNRFFQILLLTLLVFFFASHFLLLPAQKGSASEVAKNPTLKTIAVHPHDSTAFTQGLFFHNDCLYESTGHYGRSSLRKVDIKTGKVLQSVPIKAEFFGEGIEQVGDEIFMLTWKEGICFVFDRETMTFRRSLRYSGEGWGLTFNGKYLIVGDGTPVLRFYDPSDFSPKKQVIVFEGESAAKGRKIANLNELEMVDGELWANVWHTSKIVRINPESGQVLGWIDCSNFIPKEIRDNEQNPRIAERVLNGIAYDRETKRLFITGKEWSVLYELQLIR
ncbi:MAG: glutaminyl-peptide cyclotransferase [Thermoguttaceae bacterium]